MQLPTIQIFHLILSYYLSIEVKKEEHKIWTIYMKPDKDSGKAKK